MNGHMWSKTSGERQLVRPKDGTIPCWIAKMGMPGFSNSAYET